MTKAIFIDFENLRSIEDVRRITSRLNTGSSTNHSTKPLFAVAKAFSKEFLKGEVEELSLLGVKAVHTEAGSKKNLTDHFLITHTLESMYTIPKITEFHIVSGDADFIPLVLHLKENGKRVVVHGTRAGISPLLRESCDEFIAYKSSNPDADTSNWRMLESVLRESKDWIVMSSLKTIMTQKYNGFNEKNLGYTRFSQYVIAAEKDGFIEIRRDAHWKVKLRKDRYSSAIVGLLIIKIHEENEQSKTSMIGMSNVMTRIRVIHGENFNWNSVGFKGNRATMRLLNFLQDERLIHIEYMSNGANAIIRSTMKLDELVASETLDRTLVEPPIVKPSVLMKKKRIAPTPVLLLRKR